jgi:hypothetical protein
MLTGQSGDTAFLFKGQPDQFHFKFRRIAFPGKSFFGAHEVSTCKISGCLSYRILDSGPDGTQTTLTKKATALLLEMDDITELKTQVKGLNQKRTELQTTIDNMRRKASLTDKELPQLKDIDLTTKAGRVECQLILSKHLKGLTLGKDSVTVTLQNDTEITIPTDPLPLNDGTSIGSVRNSVSFQ